MTTNLPPQAYTRDTLVKAIEWLSSQPSSVRERAGSADLIVSYYLQARRRTVVQMEAPVSGENFKADLKHLAEDLKQFEEPSAPPTASRSSSLGLHTCEPLVGPSMVPPPRHEPPIFHAEPPPIYRTEPPPPRPETSQIRQEATRTAGGGLVWQVDARSLAAARELQQRFNLSSETEALRMLVTLGVERARERMP